MIDDDDDADDDNGCVSVSDVDAADKLSECPNSSIRRPRRSSLKYDRLSLISVAHWFTGWSLWIRAFDTVQ